MNRKRISVLLETEGTYPFAGGGVSTWCDILCRELHEVDFHIIALTGAPRFEVKYSIPENVRTIRQIPLWGAAEISEFVLPDIPFSEIYLKRKSTTSKIIVEKFIPLFRHLIRQTFQPDRDLLRTGEVFHQMYHYFQEYDYKETMRSELVWEAYKKEILSYHRCKCLDDAETPSLFDVTTSMRWLYHYFIPLNLPVPKTDITHASIAGFSGLNGLLAKFEHDTPFIVTDHGVFIRERYIAISGSNFTFFLKKFLINLSILISKLCYVYADQISPVCNYNTRWERIFGTKESKLKVIFNGTDPSIFIPRNKPKTADNRPTVVAAAHIMPLKDIETMIRSCDVVRKKIPNVQYVVYGSLDVDEKYTAKCQALVDELELRENFMFGGYHSRPSDLFNTGDISVLSSISEAFPYTVLESLSCARPVVATDVGGVREALEGFGIIVRPRDAQALGEGVIQLLEDAELRQNLGRLGREQILLRFKISDTIGQYMKTYRRLAFKEPPVKIQRQFENEREKKVYDLGTDVLEKIGNPIDKLAVCATLESLGWRDIDAQEEFGEPNLFLLSEEIFNICKHRMGYYSEAYEREISLERQQNVFRDFVRYYLRGLSFMIPLLGQILLIILLRYSLWAYIEFTELQATIVALGTIFSFVVTGGFIQAAGREITHYVSIDDYLMTRQSYYRLFRYNTFAVVVIGALLFIFNLIFPFFGKEMLIYSLLYYFLLAELWFNLSIIYLIKHYLAVLLVTLLGIIPVHIIMQYTKMGIFIAHFSGLIFANILAFAYGYLWLALKIRKQDLKNASVLPHRTIMAYLTSHFFVYGLLYFSFFFVDRIVSWSAYETYLPAFIIWFKTPYELGLDWGLLSLFLTIATLEYTIERFAGLLIPRQQRMSGLLAEQFNRQFRKFYYRQFLMLVIFGILSIIVAYFGVTYLKRFDHIPEIRDFFSSQVTYFTFYASAIGYFFLAIGLLNGLFFLTLSRQKKAVRAIGFSMIANFVVGFALSRWISYEFGVIGLLVGGIVFAIISTKLIFDFFNKLDFYYYSAY